MVEPACPAARVEQPRGDLPRPPRPPRRRLHRQQDQDIQSNKKQILTLRNMVVVGIHFILRFIYIFIHSFIYLFFMMCFFMMCFLQILADVRFSIGMSFCS